MTHPRPLHPGRVKKTTAKRRPAANLTPSAVGWTSAGYTAAGLVVIGFALATWAMTWLLGARQVVADLLRREAEAISGLEMAAFGLWALGFVFLLGAGWSLGVRYRRSS